MGIATHLGPWVLGTVRNTTGTTAGTVRNLGATIVAQPVTIGFASINASLTGTAQTLPAGAIVTSVQFITTAGFSSAVTLTVTINGTAWKASADTITTAGLLIVSPQATAVPVVGATDSFVTYTFVSGTTLTTGSVIILVGYVVRNPDGSIVPTSFTGP
jgi:hypothetical protein